nr:PREDICTED: uncharacterized protein LOC108222372 [Daucus carota subsp. sativus]
MEGYSEIVPFVQESESLMYFPDKVIRKDNGMLLIKPDKDYYKISDNWKNCCMGVFHNEAPVNFNAIKNALLQNYHHIGLLDVFSHPLGFLVLKFNSQRAVFNVIDCSPLSINGGKIYVHKWWERYQTNYPLAKEKVWIEISNIPFSYWSVEGLCLITSAIGKPICFDEQTFMNATKKSPSGKALIYVEVMMGAARPSVIMTSLPGLSDKNMAMVNVAYMQTSKNCLMCLSVDHTTNRCENVRELVPFNPNRKGSLEIVANFRSDSKEDSTTGDIKKPKSLEKDEELAVKSMSLIHTTLGVGHDNRVHDSVFQGNNNTDCNGLAITSHTEQVQPNETYSECHNTERVVDEAPPQETVVEQLTPRGKKRGRGRPRKKPLKQLEESYVQTLSISHGGDVVAVQESIDAPKMALNSVKHKRGRPPKNQGTNISNPQGLVAASQVMDKSEKRGRGRPRKKPLEHVGGSYVQNLSISHDRDVDAAQGSIDASQVKVKSVNHVRGRSRKNQDDNISTPQRSVDASQVALKSAKRGRGRPPKSAKRGRGRPPKNLGTDINSPQRLTETPQMILRSAKKA